MGSDLEYDGRARRRPPGASELVQCIYALLVAQPDGATLDELHAALRDGWTDTDVYRAYEKHRQAIARRRDSTGSGWSGPEYGSPLFKSRAQRWGISQAVGQMRRLGTARYEGDRWYAGDRAPRVPVMDATRQRRLVPLDVTATQAANRADTDAHVRREQAKARLLADLNDPKVAAAAKRSPTVQRLLDTIAATFEHLSGR